VADWDRIVHEHGALVYRTAWRILGHAADTEDVVQEVFLQVHQFVQSRPVRHWSGLLRRLAACRALDRLRQRRCAQSLDGLELACQCETPEDALVSRELAERLRQAIAELPPREAEVFCLRYFDELSYQDIADTLAITGGAVAMALHKARAKLETRLGYVETDK
jgi:RNA polymerase sigma-70 factor (ECF subfamily)